MKTVFHSFLFLLIFSCNLYASSVDSLKSIFKNEVNFQKRSNAVFTLVRSYKDLLELKELDEYYSFIRSNFQDGKYSDREYVEILHHIAHCYNNNENYEYAKDLYLSEIKYLNKNDSVGSFRIANLYNYVGKCLANQNNFDSAQFYYMKSITESNKYNYKYIRAQSYYNLGRVQTIRENYNSALLYHYKSLHIRNERKKPIDMISSNFHLGNLMLIKGNIDSAYLYFINSLKFHKLNNRFLSAKIFFLMASNYNLGQIQLKNNNLDSALFHFVNSYSLAQQQGDSVFIIRSLIALSNTEYEKSSFYNDLIEKQNTTTTYSNRSSLLSLEEINSINKYFTDIPKVEFVDYRLNNQELKIQNRTIILILLALLLLMSLVVYFLRLTRVNRDKVTAELFALRLQMNPHFLSNSISAIINTVLEDQKDVAQEYLIKLARMLRLVLSNSQYNKISLNKELILIDSYIDMQQLRFDRNFIFEKEIPANINMEESIIPPMLLQPFIENSIEHGFSSKVVNPKIILSVDRINNKEVKVCITDNGIGIKKSRIIRKRNDGQGVGTINLKERIKKINNIGYFRINLKITDLSDSSQYEQQTGTAVYLTIKSKKQINTLLNE